MVSKALHEIAVVKEVDEVSYYAGEKQYYFILGKDVNKIQWMIWLNEDDIHYKPLSNWVRKEEIEQRALEMVPNIEIIRIAYGVNEQEQLIYEVLYQDKEERLGYIYFNLFDGKLIKIYRLGKME